ncbi:CrtC domain-containing protein [Fusarium keratoplasticum]|uniref:CrtC domain-containing protein n=1 Tax=Fusarium keratoplasticum TaxID=1328300 RepID=A0ACC0QAU1_9HYPO|nr:CrtC domain-containing protein [Fusarium keratoplasticum]KAI8648193.1 CrtC domain-containing protein [Fusarium keratoplasticum]
MAQPNQGRLLTDDASMSELGLHRSKFEEWEDGLRSPNTESGEYEWWYADGHLQDGWFVQVAFFYNSEGAGTKAGLIDFNIAKDGEKVCDLHKRFELSANLQVGKDKCHVQFEKSSFRSIDGLRKYHIHVDPDEMEGFGADVTITAATPSYRPGTGRWDVDGRHFSWFVAVPGGQLTGEIITNGTKTKVEGNAYHDHNWGNVPMENILDNWLWGRADVHGLTIVSASVRFRQDCGGREVPLLFIVQGDEVLVNAVNEQLVCLEGVKRSHPVTSKPTSTDCIYLVNSAGEGAAEVRFNGQSKVVATFPFPTTSKDWETWYTRYAGLVTVNIVDGEKRIRTSDLGTLEVMDFFGRKK